MIDEAVQARAKECLDYRDEAEQMGIWSFARGKSTLDIQDKDKEEGKIAAVRKMFEKKEDGVDLRMDVLKF